MMSWRTCSALDWDTVNAYSTWDTGMDTIGMGSIFGERKVMSAKRELLRVSVRIDYNANDVSTVRFGISSGKLLFILNN